MYDAFLCERMNESIYLHKYYISNYKFSKDIRIKYLIDFFEYEWMYASIIEPFEIWWIKLKYLASFVTRIVNSVGCKIRPLILFALPLS